MKAVQPSALEDRKKEQKEKEKRWKEKWEPMSGCCSPERSEEPVKFKDYIGISDIRLFKGQARGGNAPPDNPVEAMQKGMPVLYYNVERGKAGKFEQRLLKVDDQLDFMYIMYETTDTRRGQESNPVVLKLDAVEAIYGTSEALRLCKHFNIFDPHLQAESAVVLKLAQWEGAEDKDGKPHPDRIIIFIAPPQQHLRACITACKTKVEAFSTKLTEAGKWRLAGVRLLDNPLPVINLQSEARLEYHLKPDDDVEAYVPLDSHRSETTKVELPLEALPEKEVQDIGEKHACKFHAVDAARIEDVLEQVNWCWQYCRAVSSFFYRGEDASPRGSKQIKRFFTDSKEIELLEEEVLQQARTILTVDDWIQRVKEWEQNKEEHGGDEELAAGKKNHNTKKDKEAEEAKRLEEETMEKYLKWRKPLKGPRIAMRLLLDLEKQAYEKLNEEQDGLMEGGPPLCLKCGKMKKPEEEELAEEAAIERKEETFDDTTGAPGPDDTANALGSI